MGRRTAEPASAEPAARRRGARRIAEIPREVLAQLNAGQTETVNLVEWLAVDMPALLQAILPHVGLGPSAPRILARLDGVGSLGVNARSAAISRALGEAAYPHRRRESVIEALAAHRSDIVRCWAAQVAADAPDRSLAERLAAVRRFAADSHFGVREAAWMAARPWIARDVPAALTLLTPWAHDTDARIRRFASEATRPRGVWCTHLTELKEDPAPALPLLEPLRADPARYVQDSVSNWLNDASKSRPEWVTKVCRRWRRESKSPYTERIVQRALRTIEKNGNGATTDVSSRKISSAGRGAPKPPLRSSSPRRRASGRASS